MENNATVDPVKMYLRELETIVPLTGNEEGRLFQKLDGSAKWNEEQELAARRIIETHLRLVVGVAEKHLSSGIPMLELLQEGNMGLMNAVRSFAAQPAGDFSSYATTRINEAITRAIEKR